MEYNRKGGRIYEVLEERLTDELVDMLHYPPSKRLKIAWDAIYDAFSNLDEDEINPGTVYVEINPYRRLLQSGNVSQMLAIQKERLPLSGDGLVIPYSGIDYVRNIRPTSLPTRFHSIANLGNDSILLNIETASKLNNYLKGYSDEYLSQIMDGKKVENRFNDFIFDGINLSNMKTWLSRSIAVHELVEVISDRSGLNQKIIDPGVDVEIPKHAINLVIGLLGSPNRHQTLNALISRQGLASDVVSYAQRAYRLGEILKSEMPGLGNKAHGEVLVAASEMNYMGMSGIKEAIKDAYKDVDLKNAIPKSKVMAVAKFIDRQELMLEATNSQKIKELQENFFL